MATLRDLGLKYVPIDPEIAAANDRAEASGMTQLGRGFRAGRLGGDINALAADEASLRAAGRDAEAQGLRDQIVGLQGRAAAFAPREQDVAALGASPGRILDWASGQVGQGAASMLDPALAAAAGTALTFVPHPLAQAAGRVAQLAAPFAINQRQLKGENYNAMVEDPALMARTTAQQRDDMAGYGAIPQAALDSIVPIAAGSRFVGTGLRKGVSRFSPGTRFVGEQLVEGTTELGQEALKKSYLGDLNPDRDTSGDLNDYINAFAGGAVGSAGVSAPSLMVDSAARRAGQTATDMGSALDGMKPGEKLKAMFSRAKEGAGQAVDLATGKAKEAADAGGDLMEQLRTAPQRFADANAERELLRDGLPIPDNVQAMFDAKDFTNPELQSYIRESDGQREALVRKKLSERADDAAAQDLLKALDTEADKPAAVKRGAEYILDNDRVAQINKWGKEASERLGQVLPKKSKKSYEGAADEGDSIDRALVAAGFKDDSNPHAKLRDQAELLARYMGGEARKANPRAERAADVAEDAAFTLSRQALIHSGRGKITGNVQPLNRVAQRLSALYGASALDKVNEAESILSKQADARTVGGAKAVTDYLRNEIAGMAEGAGTKRRADLAQKMADVLSPEHEAVLMKHDVNLRDAGSRDELYGAIERLVTSGRQADRDRAARLFGKENVEKMVEIYGEGPQEALQSEFETDDGDATDGEGFSTGSYQARMAEKAAAEGAGATTYVYKASGANTMRSAGDKRKPVYEPGATKFIAGDDVTSSGEKRLDVALRQAQERFGADYDVKALTARELQKEQGIQNKAFWDEAGITDDMTEQQQEDALARYLDSRYVIKATLAAKRIPGRIEPGELNRMAVQGQEAYKGEEARHFDPEKNTTDKAGFGKALDERNVLFFPNSERYESGPKQGRRKSPIKILAGDLATWGMQHREAALQAPHPAKGGDREFLDGLEEGISAVLASGKADGAPYRITADGKKEAFSAKGAPPSLRLRERTAGELAKAEKGERVEKAKAEAEAIKDEIRTTGQDVTEEAIDDVKEMRKNAELTREPPSDTDTTKNAVETDRDTGQAEEAARSTRREIKELPAMPARRLLLVAQRAIARNDGDTFKFEGKVYELEKQGKDFAVIDGDGNQVMLVATTKPAPEVAGGKLGKTSSAPSGAQKPSAPLRVRDIALQEQREAGWDHNWPFIPADLLMADFRELITNDPSLSAAEKSRIFEAGKRLGVVPKAATAKSAQGPSPDNPASQAQMDEAREYVRKVLGAQVKVEFERITGFSGEWVEAENLIKISTIAGPGALHTAYHEALHAFWSRLGGNPEVRELLTNVTSNPVILQRLKGLLAGEKKAIAQLDEAEERVAYAYQFWAAGRLDVGSKATTLFRKVKAAFRRVLGMVRDEDRALAIFEAFHAGELAEPSAAGRALQRIMGEGTWTKQKRREWDRTFQAIANLAMPAEYIARNSGSATAARMSRMFYTSPGEEGAAKHGEGYLNASRRMTGHYLNRAGRALEGLTQRDLADVERYLQRGEELKNIPYQPHKAAVSAIRQAFQDFHAYAKEAGMDLGHTGSGRYYPRTWSVDKLVAGKEAFIKMLLDNHSDVLQSAIGKTDRTQKDIAEALWQTLVDRGGVEDKLDAQRDDGVLTPFFAAQGERNFKWLKTTEVEPYLEKDLSGQLTRYFRQGVRSAEYTRRFGPNGEKLRAALDKEAVPINLPNGKTFTEYRPGPIEKELIAEAAKQKIPEAERSAWVARRMDGIRQAFGAMEGVLGKDIDPTWRKFSSWAMVYQNIRLLPLALFSSIVDPLGLVARGGSMEEAYQGFLRGMREVYRGWRDAFSDEPGKHERDAAEALAEEVGAVDSQHFLDSLGSAYASEYLDERARSVNNKLFMMNGMERWNRGMRIQATQSAVRFIERHAGKTDADSVRWMNELGLTNIPMKDGRLVTSVDERVAMLGPDAPELAKQRAREQVRQVHFAINRWVEGAILTPNAAQRPAWASDPHYAFLFHLKQFTYSFHQTILRRAGNELKYGNLGPMAAFIWYVPVMIAADVTKGLIQGGGELPNYMKGYTLGDWVMHGVQRAGLLGLGQMALDTEHDLFSTLGPTVEQITDAFRDPAATTLVKALPGMPLYKEALL